MSAATTAKAVPLIGSPRKLPTRMARFDGVKREKSQKLSMSVA